MRRILQSPAVRPVPATGTTVRGLAEAVRWSGWPADFRASFEQNAPFVRRTLRRLGVPPADAEDLLQEIFVVVHRRLGEYDGRSAFRSWLYGICMRVVSSYRRSARVRYQRSQADGALDECESHIACNPERNVEVRRACRLLEALLIDLDDDKRNVFVLFELEGIAMTEVAETLGCPVQTAYSRLHAARRALRVLVIRHRDTAPVQGKLRRGAP